MLVAIHQPNLLPRPKVIDKLLAADLVIHLDDVQYVPREWQNRTRIRRRDGRLHWLSVPVRSRGRGRQTLIDCEIDPQAPWRRKHLETLRHCYGRTPWWPQFDELIAPLWSSAHEDLVSLCIESTERIVRGLGRELNAVRASSLATDGRATAHLVELCEAVGATGYLSGTGALAYMDIDSMKAAGLRVFLQTDREDETDAWRGVSILDPMLRIGPDDTARAFLRGDYEEV